MRTTCVDLFRARDCLVKQAFGEVVELWPLSEAATPTGDAGTSKLPGKFV